LRSAGRSAIVPDAMAKIGIISDTHGYLSDAACNALNGVSRIVHAGDIGGTRILKRLSRIAPVTAVRGNMDGGPWAEEIASTEVLQVAGHHVFVLHDLSRLDLDPAAAGFSAVACGHTHQAAISRHNGVLLINPGSASRPRRGTRCSIAVLDLIVDPPHARIVKFDC